jgi:hypothetical protein
MSDGSDTLEKVSVSSHLCVDDIASLVTIVVTNHHPLIAIQGPGSPHQRKASGAIPLFNSRSCLTKKCDHGISLPTGGTKNDFASNLSSDDVDVISIQ